MGDLIRDINALPDDVDDDLKDIFLRLARNDASLSSVDLRFRLETAGELEVVILARSIESNTSLKELTLASNKLNDAKLKVLCESLAKNRALIKLDLSFNAITNGAVPPLVKAIQQNATMQQVMLFQNPITSESQQLVTEALKSDMRGKGGAATGNPEDKRVIEALQKELHTVKQERDMFRQKIDDMEKEMAAMRKNLGSNPQPRASPLAASQGGRVRKEKTINCENVQVMEKLAETGGSSASVFSCNVDGWNCAMKEMDLSGMHGESAANFEGEIGLLERLPFHNNICRYLFHDKRNNKLRLFMTKYASSLRKIITDRRKEVDATPPRNRYWSREEIITMLLDVAKGLVFLHQNNVIHRDLKSDNIFVTLNERKDVSSLAIGDFDTAKRVTTVNQAKTILGTPGYIAPEVLQSNEAGGYSFKADVFSFGMVIYELLTLKLPFEDEMPFLVATQIMKGQKPPLPDHLDETYDDLKDLFLKCTAFKPQQRPDMLAVKEELVKLC